jgi:hypothetical protein
MLSVRRVTRLTVNYQFAGRKTLAPPPDKTVDQRYIFTMATELAAVDAEDLKSRLSELRRFL